MVERMGIDSANIKENGMGDGVTVEQMDAAGYAVHRAELADLLRATVAAGGAVGFLDPVSEAEALDFWDGHVGAGVALFVATVGGALAGTVSLNCALPPNQPHRGDVCKMMVHPGFRRQGVARAMMAAVEAEARARGLALLVLDTRTGDAAQGLYTACGFEAVGEIPGYALDTDGGAVHGTTVMFRRLP